jgi:hypothetical protein
MRRRRKWFQRLDLHMVLWWVPTGHRPTVEEAEQHLELLGERRPTPAAFTFQTSFDSPSTTVERLDDRWQCPA